MPAPTGSAAWLAIAGALAVSAGITAIAIRYARHRRLLDHPGARRSHSVPTPRGGGIGIVVAVLAFACVPDIVRGPAAPRAMAIALAVAVAIVAAVGWIDDHRGLPARTRFAAHCIAALAFLAPIVWSLLAFALEIGQAASLSVAVIWLAMIAVAVAIVWSINLHNFMDGIDGLLAAQSIFVFAAIAALMAMRDADPRALEVAIFGAAVLGFLPFNFPRARIFMGDVGSGVLGLLVAVAVLRLFGDRTIAYATGLMLCSAFVVDATATLVSRVVRGRRWYSAHREHLYQWLVRSGFSHAGVVTLYMGWNLLVVVPVVAWINRAPPTMDLDNPPLQRTGIAEAAAVYLLGIGVWILGKRRCLEAKKRRGADAAP